MESLRASSHLTVELSRSWDESGCCHSLWLAIRYPRAHLQPQCPSGHKGGNTLTRQASPALILIWGEKRAEEGKRLIFCGLPKCSLSLDYDKDVLMTQKWNLPNFVSKSIPKQQSGMSTERNPFLLTRYFYLWQPLLYSNWVHLKIPARRCLECG